MRAQYGVNGLVLGLLRKLLLADRPPSIPRPVEAGPAGAIIVAAQEAHRRQNRVHTALLLGGIGLLLAVPVTLIWGWFGLAVAAVLVVVMVVAARQTPPELIMRAYKAVKVTDQAGSGAQLLRIVDALSERAALPHPPLLYVIPSLTLNAFAMGQRDRATIAITEGLLRRLTIKEVAAVLAHEVSHVKNNDLAVMAIADVSTRLVQAMSYLAVFLIGVNVFSWLIDGEPNVSWLAILLLYLAPMLSSLLQLGLSRTREYDADLEAALLVGNPAWLSSALARLERDSGALWEDLMLPVPGRRVPQPSLLRSHPTIEDRLSRLEALSPQANLPPILIREEPFVSMSSAGTSAMRPRYRFPGIWF